MLPADNRAFYRLWDLSSLDCPVDEGEAITLPALKHSSTSCERLVGLMMGFERTQFLCTFGSCSALATWFAKDLSGFNRVSTNCDVVAIPHNNATGSHPARLPQAQPSCTAHEQQLPP